MLRLNADKTTSLDVAMFVAAMALGMSAAFTPALAQQTNSNIARVSSASTDLDTVFASHPCNGNKALGQLDAPIARLSKRIDAHEPVVIVALGSSSTAGSGASTPAFSYPSRLAAELKRRFPRDDILVINQGVNGEEAGDMMARMDDVLKAKPDLVLWQVGTNAVMRDHDIKTTGELLQSGIGKIRDHGSDVLLIDPQFAPAVNKKSKIADMLTLIGGVAKRMHVPLFKRYTTMRHWNEDQAIGFDRFIMPDGLHMNDWGYSCFARLLADNIATAVTRSRSVADVKPLQ